MSDQSKYMRTLERNASFEREYLTPERIQATVKLLQDAFPELPWAEENRGVTLSGIEQTQFGGALNNLAETLNEALIEAGAAARSLHVSADEKGDLISKNTHSPKDGPRHEKNEFHLQTVPFVDHVLTSQAFASEDSGKVFMDELKANAELQAAIRTVRDKIALAKAGVNQKTEGRSPT